MTLKNPTEPARRGPNIPALSSPPGARESDFATESKHGALSEQPAGPSAALAGNRGALHDSESGLLAAIHQEIDNRLPANCDPNDNKASAKPGLSGAGALADFQQGTGEKMPGGGLWDQKSQDYSPALGGAAAGAFCPADDKPHAIASEIKARISAHPSDIGANDADIASSYQKLQEAFHAFQTANDRRLHDLERRQNSDPLIEEKLNRITKTLDQQNARIERTMLDARKPAREPRDAMQRAPHIQEHKHAFENYFRTGDDRQLRMLEQKALTFDPASSSRSSEEFLMPQESELAVLERLSASSAIRSIAGNRQISGGQLTKLVSAGASLGQWGDENMTASAIENLQLKAIEFQAMRLYAVSVVRSSLLEDSALDVEQWIADEVESAFAEKENAAFVAGNAANTPKGFLKYPINYAANPEFGKISARKTGTNKNFSPAPFDDLINLIYSLKPSYRANARFVMNRTTQAQIRKYKDSNGQYLWQPPQNVGQTATLMGYPLSEVETMPSFSGTFTYAGANGADEGSLSQHAPAIAFGDFRRGYLVVDRLGITILRDPYSSKPNILFYITKRVAGGVQDFNAIKLLIFSS